MPRNNPNLEDQMRIIRDKDFIRLAIQMNIKKRTAYAIIFRYIRNGQVGQSPHGGARNSKVDDEMRNVIINLIEENPVITLDQ